MVTHYYTVKLGLTKAQFNEDALITKLFMEPVHSYMFSSWLNEDL